ncbi:uncharacterized protein LOC103714152 isoform X2 [Phoenix dactylifera]|uniref:Uncharacterized protein LOC103714152 isoform X2 n=1 Tax=Phoenix dactylifera TaxID=42345 RepID=A0A8B7CHV6_PHODC|nr:uncharacterized protein LOC103714152 isoform X2 [Phoenix dactylifera]
MEATPLPSSRGQESSAKNPTLSPPSPSLSLSPSPSRLWRPAAQRNLRNQWSKLLSSKDRWVSAASEGRARATSLVNAYLSRKYLPEMDLGVLKDMPGIRQKACDKLAQKQELYHNMLISSYKEMVVAVSHLVKASSSMRCFLKGSVAGPLVQFCDHPENKNDFGDGGGIPVFSSFPISHFENLAQELVEMFALELSLKRLLVVELLSISWSQNTGQIDGLKWSDELYLGEFDDLRMNGLYSEESCEPLPPRIKNWDSSIPLTRHLDHPPKSEVLQVYLTTWLADVNINMNRLSEIFATVEEEMQVQLS